MNTRRLLLIRVMAVCVVLGIVEVICMIFIRFFLEPQYPHFFAVDYSGFFEKIDDSYFELYRTTRYDAELGWDWQPNDHQDREKWTLSTDEFGRRTNPYAESTDRELISVFGDSYTFGDEVNNDETFAFYLSRLTDSNVLNFGVGGYGIDQAVLKFRRKLKEGLETPIVVLSMVPDLSRLVTVFRPFYNISSGLTLAFKPTVTETQDGGHTWVPNPLQKLESRDDARAALAVAKEYDFFYRARALRNAFPYTLDALRFALMLGGALDIPRQNQWHNETAVGRIEFVVAEFVRLALANNMTPVFMFIPNSAELREKVAGKRPSTRNWLDKVRDQYADTPLIIVDVFERDFDPRKFGVRGLDGHASAYGNEQVAEALYEALRPVLNRQNVDARVSGAVKK